MSQFLSKVIKITHGCMGGGHTLGPGDLDPGRVIQYQPVQDWCKTDSVTAIQHHMTPNTHSMESSLTSHHPLNRVHTS